MPMTPVVVAPDEAVIQHGKLLAPALVFKSLTPTRRFAQAVQQFQADVYSRVLWDAIRQSLEHKDDCFIVNIMHIMLKYMLRSIFTCSVALSWWHG